MTDREKLVELLSEFHCVHVGIEERKVTIEMNAFDIADHLIENGVTVQNWRDAKTDPPELKNDVLMLFESGTMAVGFLTDDTGWCSNTDNELYTYCEIDPVKWMPLPKAPKED